MLTAQFNHENNHIYSRYDDVRSKYLADEKKIGILVRVLNRQERIINELKAYIGESLEQIFLKVEVLDPEVVSEIA